MSSLTTLLDLPHSEMEKRGVVHTPREIAQQPDCWKNTAAIIRAQTGRLEEFLARSGIPGNPNTRLVFCGAGSSECTGQAIESAFRRNFQVEADTRATTDCLTHLDSFFLPGRDYLAVHFSRSGDTPESVATHRLIRRKFPTAGQLIITCNRHGALAQTADQDPRSLAVVLPEETNDQGLAMTSSVSSMMLAALGVSSLGDLDTFDDCVAHTCAAGHRALAYADVIQTFADQPWTRAAFLGSGPLLAIARESHIKLTEMTDGQIMCRYDSFLSFRHGPKVVANADCAIIAFVSSTARVRAYELDLLRELQNQPEKPRILAVTHRVDDALRSICPDVLELAPEGEPLTDEWAALSHVVIAQLLGLFKSLTLGLSPDNPCKNGAINRVVQGVRIYDE